MTEDSGAKPAIKITSRERLASVRLISTDKSPIIPNDGSIREAIINGRVYRFMLGFGEEIISGQLKPELLPGDIPRLVVIDNLRLETTDGTRAYKKVPTMITHGDESYKGSAVNRDLFIAQWQIDQRPVGEWLRALDMVVGNGHLPIIALLIACHENAAPAMEGHLVRTLGPYRTDIAYCQEHVLMLGDSRIRNGQCEYLQILVPGKSESFYNLSNLEKYK